MKNLMSAQVDGIPTSFSNLKREQSNIYETLKRMLMGIGTRMARRGGMQKIFRQMFAAREEEKLLKVSPCYLSTTAGPIAGFLFISTEKVAFCSKRSLRFTSPSGELIRTPYKVIIPLKKIKRSTESENVHEPTQKYLEIFTVDSFDFWFMGFVDYQKTFKYVQHVESNPK
ncbi:hypothetical protein ACHQM5_004976 [Ranunculus cassubicifolius]